MTTLRLEQPGTLRIVADQPVAEPGPGEALVRVHRVGVCGTDYHAYRGKQPFFSYPRILGHEVGVEVIALGADVTNVGIGDHCAIEPYIDCGTCIACRRGRNNACVNMQVLGVHIDGAHRERFTLPARKLHRSASLTFDQLALVETLGIGAHAVERARVGADDTVLVLGVGPIGLSAVQFAQAAGARTVVMDPNQERLRFVRERFAVSETLSPAADPQATESLLKERLGELPTVVIDATGAPPSMAAAFNYPCHGGTLVFVGLFPGDITFNDPNFHRRELTLMGSRNAASADFRRIITLIEQGRIDTGPWITHRAAAADLPQRITEWLNPASGVLKAMLSFS